MLADAAFITMSMLLIQCMFLWYSYVLVVHNLMAKCLKINWTSNIGIHDLTSEFLLTGTSFNSVYIGIRSTVPFQNGNVKESHFQFYGSRPLSPLNCGKHSLGVTILKWGLKIQVFRTLFKHRLHFLLKSKPFLWNWWRSLENGIVHHRWLFSERDWKVPWHNT